jgi:hypothetical protein
LVLLVAVLMNGRLMKSTVALKVNGWVTSVTVATVILRIHWPQSRWV